MSATFRLDTKKKVSQDELRRLMAQQKKPKPTTTKINNPLAKYNESGQLTCALCGTVVRSENVWQVHVNAKLHKDNVAEAKRLKELTNNFTSAAKIKKRTGTQPLNAPAEKKIKGILKNAPKTKIISTTIVPPKSIPNDVSFQNDVLKNSIKSKHQKLTGNCLLHSSLSLLSYIYIILQPFSSQIPQPQKFYQMAKHVLHLSSRGWYKINFYDYVL